MGKVHVGDLLCIGHKLWYQIGCGPGMPGPYRVAGRFTARIVGGGVLDAPRADASIGPYSDEMTVFVRVDVRICPHNAKKAQPKLNVT
mgnify:CR=1 FL=1